MEVIHIIPEEETSNLLLKHGCPKDELWLCEDQTIDAFERFYGFDTCMDLNLYNFKRVMYYHESGSLHVTAGYNTAEEKEKAAGYIANYLKS